MFSRIAAGATPVLLLLLALLPTAAAQEALPDVDAIVIEVAPWLRADDWKTGAILSLAGAIGAAIAMFSLLGGIFPGHHNAKSLEDAEKRLEEYERVMHRHITKNGARSVEEAQVIASLDDAVNHLRDDTRRERWHQYKLGAILFILIGTGLAALFAQNALTALVIGASWTSIAAFARLKMGKEPAAAEEQRGRKRRPLKSVRRVEVQGPESFRQRLDKILDAEPPT